MVAISGAVHADDVAIGTAVVEEAADGIAEMSDRAAGEVLLAMQGDWSIALHRDEPDERRHTRGQHGCATLDALGEIDARNLQRSHRHYFCGAD
jgi:hypothetical protein